MQAKSATAFVFPGQGSQYVGMGRELLDVYPQLREAFAEAESVLGKDYLALCLNGPEDELNDTRNTQVCIYVVSCAIYAILEAAGIKPQLAAGHSLGEYSALTAVKTFKFSEGLRIVSKRAELMAEEGSKRPGKMLAVLGADMRSVDDVVRELSGRGVISVANYNCPGQIVVSLDAGLVDEAKDALLATGAKKVVALPVSGAFHSALMSEAERQFNKFLDNFIFMNAEIPVVPNTIARPEVEAVELRAALQSQISSSVKWQQSVEQMIGLGIKTFVEVGPGQVLSKIIKRIDKQVETLTTDTPEALRATIERLVER